MMRFKLLKKKFIEKWVAVIAVVAMITGVCYGFSTGTI